MKIKRESDYLIGFNFASLTDIVLMLLIFFMLSSSYIIQDGFKMKLPESRVAETHNQKSISISITEKQIIFLNGKKISKQNLGAELRRDILNSPESVVVIRAAKNLSLQAVVDVLDLAKSAGAQKFLIATRNDL